MVTKKHHQQRNAVTVQFKGLKVQRSRKRSIYSITQVFTNMHRSLLVVLLPYLCIGSVYDMLILLFVFGFFIFKFLHFVDKVLLYIQFQHNIAQQSRERNHVSMVLLLPASIVKEGGKMKERHDRGSSKRVDKQRIDKRQREREMKSKIIYSHFHCVSRRSHQCFSEVWNRQRARVVLAV